MGSLSNLACVLPVSGGVGGSVGGLTWLVFSLFQGVWGAVVGSLSNLACVLHVSGGGGGGGGSGGVAV